MKKNFFLVVIIFITLLLSGLVGIQLYWIRSAVILREANFKRSVAEAVTNTINKLEKIEVASALRNRVYGTKHDATIFTTLDSINLLFNIEMEKMLNGYITSDTSQRNYQTEKISVNLSEYERQKSLQYVDTNKLNINTIEGDKIYEMASVMDTLPALLPSSFYDSISNQINTFLKKTFIISDVFEDIFCIKQYQQLEKRINFEILDSILSIELANKGINTTFEFGVFNSVKNKLIYQRSGRYPNELLTEGYPFNLFPSDLFVTPEYFLIYFPYQKKFLLTRMWVMLLVSFLLIFLVILSFLYAFSTIIKQRKLSEMKNDFINNMTHEFKTPVSTIALACEALSDKHIEKSSDLYTTYINIISEENKRLGAIAENVLQTALIDKGKINFKFEEVDIKELIEKCINNFGLQLKRHNADIHLHIRTAQALILGDKEHLRNMFNNLIDNALKYSGNRLRLDISLAVEENQLLISFKDNGIGISKTNQKKIFDKLYRVHVGNLHNVKGFGLGLSYVKTIVEKHNGTIKVESELRKGSVFSITLPLLNKDQNIN